MNLSQQVLELAVNIKIIWVIFMILTWLFWQWRKTSGAVFVCLLGVFLASTYAIVAFSSKTMFWGMVGDEAFIAHIFEHQAWGRLAADFTSHSLPLFYPPLYFIIGGLLGIIINFSGIGLAKIMATLTLLISPIIFYSLLRYWHKQDFTSESSALTVALLMTALPFDAMFLKPYEMLSGISMIIICSSILVHIWRDVRISRRQWIFASISLSVLFAVFYFWFFLLAFSLIILIIIGPRRIELLKKWSVLGVIVFLTSTWYWYPNISTFIKYGYENWQPLFFIKSDLNIFLPFFSGLSLLGSMIFIFAIIITIWQRKSVIIHALVALISSAYLYQLINYLVYINGGRPMQPSKGYLFFAMPAIILIAGYGLQQLFKNNLKFFAPIIIIIASLFTLPALGLESPRLLSQLDKNFNYNFLYTKELNSLFKINNLRDKVLLTSGMPELEARAPYQEYLTHNINLAHPALGFTERYNYIQQLLQSKNPQEFADLYINAPRQTIDGMLFFHDGQKYYLYYWLDNFPNGGREEILSFNKGIIDSKYFEIKNISDEFDLIVKK